MKVLQASVKKGKKKPAAKKAAPKKGSAAAPAKKNSGGQGKRAETAGGRDARMQAGKAFEKRYDSDDEESRPQRVITEKDPRFSLDKFKGSKVDSRGKPVAMNRVKKGDLTSKSAPKDIKRYYKQLRVDQGQEVDEDEDASADVSADGSSSDFEDDSISLGSDVYDAEEQEEEMEEATCRLAMKNCDWDHLSAQHLYALMQSFTPMGGALVSVSVYLSEYGKEQLEHERVHGPNIWMREGDAEFLEEQRIRAEEEEEGGEEAPEFVQEEGSDADASEEDADAFEDDFVEDNAEIREEVLEGEMFSENKYRRYEIQRLKYYYAIVEFDSAETAAHVFKECEGTEVERSGNVFDLSFVPDDMDFGEPKESANSLAPSYKGQTFVTNALQNGRFAISWDQTDPKRKRAMTAYSAADDENLDDLDAYLAPAESSEDDDSADPDEKRRAIRRKYSALFEGLGGLAEDLPSEGRGGGGGDDDDDDDEDASDDGSEEPGSEEAGVHATWSESDGDEGAGAGGSDDEALVAAQLAALPSDDEGDDEGGGVSGNLEATMHLGAKDGGKTLAETLRIKKERENETVWEKRQRLKKEGRKQAKKERKGEAAKPRAQMTPEERRAEKEEQARRTARLTEVMGESAQDFDEDEEGPRRGKFVSKKDKRKEHKARAVEAAQKLRDEKKQKRAAALAEKVGAAAAPAAAAAKQPEEAKPVSKLMARFGSKLADPRYNPDVNHPKFQKDDKMQEVVGEIRETRKRKRASADASKSAKGGDDASAAATPDISSTVDYFKAKAAKVKRTN